MIRWTEYTATIKLRERLVGGIPIIPEGAERADAYEKWARGQGVEPADAHELSEDLADDPEMPVSPEEIEGLITGFRRDESDNPYVEARQVKAMLRESAQRLGIIKKTRGVRQVLQHDLIVRGLDGSQRLPLEPSMSDVLRDTRPISVVTMQGPRTALKTFEYVKQPTLQFSIRILSGGVGDGLIDREKLEDMLSFGGELGIGADRSQGEGTFDLVELQEAA